MLVGTDSLKQAQTMLNERTGLMAGIHQHIPIDQHRSRLE